MLATISDPFGERDIPVVASHPGVVIGHNSLPLVNEGDALFHVARVDHPRAAEAALEAMTGSVLEDEDAEI